MHVSVVLEYNVCNVCELPKLVVVAFAAKGFVDFKTFLRRAAGAQELQATMRAWLLLLAVLATFQTIVQVASTEDISTRFIAAIAPTTTTKAIINYNNNITKTTTTTTTALAKAFTPFNEFHLSNNNNNSSDSDIIKNKIKNKSKHSKSANNNNNNTLKQFNEVHKTRTDQLENSKNSKTKHNKHHKQHKLNNNNHKHKKHNKNKMAIKEQQQQQRTQTAIANVFALEPKASAPTPTPAFSANYNTDTDTDTNSHTDSVLGEFEVPGIADAIIVEDEPATYSSKEIIKDKVKPDPSTLVEIENSLLSLFNMKRPPKIDRSKIIIPEAMKKLYAQIMGHELDSVNIPKPGLLTKSANTVRSFTHKDSKIDDRFPHHHRFRLHFDVKSIPGDEKLKAAELQLTRDALSVSSTANRSRYQVLVYDITRVGVRGKREPSYLLLDTKTVRLNSTETVSLDVQPAVDRWLATPHKNYGLLVEVRTMRSLKPAPHHHVRLRRSADEAHDDWQHKQPLLFTYTDDGRHKARSIRDVGAREGGGNGGGGRNRRHQRRSRRKNHEEICRRHSLYVDFQDVGWSDWIVAPPGYDAFYCHGKCPFPLADHLNSTNHAVVQTLVNNLNPGKVPKACCVPTQLEGISMLYLNDQRTVVLKNYPDMTVVGCGCR